MGAVHEVRHDSLPDGELDGVAADLLVDRDDGDLARADRPQPVVAPRALGAVRGVELRLDGVGERRELVVRDVLVDDHRSILERDEVDGVAREVGFGGDDGVPLTRPRDAVHACLVPRRDVVA